MASTRKIAAIVNPHSAGGRTGRKWLSMARCLEEKLGPFTTRFTEHSGHAIELTRELLRERFDLIVGVGGDGTFNEIANGLLPEISWYILPPPWGFSPPGQEAIFSACSGFRHVVGRKRHWRP